MMYSYNMVSSKFPKTSQMRLKDVAGPTQVWLILQIGMPLLGQLAVLGKRRQFFQFSHRYLSHRSLPEGHRSGEETGGNGYIISGDSRMLHLPNTGIVAYIPRRQYVIQDPAGKQPAGHHSGISDFTGASRI